MRWEPGPALRGTDRGGGGAFDPFHSPGGCLSQTRPVGPRVEPFVELTQLGTAINCPHRGAGAVTSTRSGEVSLRKEVSEAPCDSELPGTEPLICSWNKIISNCWANGCNASTVPYVCD